MGTVTGASNIHRYTCKAVIFFLKEAFIYSFIHSFLAALGLCCCTQLSLVVVSRSFSLVVVASLIAEYEL